MVLIFKQAHGDIHNNIYLLRTEQKARGLLNQPRATKIREDCGHQRITKFLIGKRHEFEVRVPFRNKLART